MAIPAFPLGLVAGVYVLYRYSEHDFDIGETIKAMEQDWEKICEYGKEAIGFVRELLTKSRHDIQSLEDFQEAIERITTIQESFDELPDEVRRFINRDNRVTKILEGMMRDAITGYAVHLLEAEAKTPTKLLEARYLSLYLIGRIDGKLKINQSTSILDELIKAHSARLKTTKTRALDESIVAFLQNLHSSEALTQGLIEALEAHPVIKRLTVRTDYILHAFMPGCVGSLDHRNLMAEMSERFMPKSD